MTFTVDRQQFRYHTDPRTGTTCVQSIHPYDETEYHWARRTATGTWVVRLEGKAVATLPRTLTEAQVARELLNLDRAAHLTRRGGIW